MKKASILALVVLCVAIHYRGFNAWFRADDFAWMGLALGVHNFHDLLKALFAPGAEGTIRLLSERGFFIAGYALFGLNALPFRMAIFATQFANLGLVSSIGDRLTGVRGAGFCAAVFWLVNNSQVEPLGWACVYNQVLAAFFLLLAFHFLLRFVETGQARYNRYQWIAFLLGFGAMELNMVYPALAAGYTLLCARQYFRRTLPLFVPSMVYLVVHRMAAMGDRNTDYALHFTGSMVRTLAKYWAWSVGPLFFWTPVELPKWLIPAGVVVVSLGLLAFAVERGHTRRAAFCIAWFVIAIAPVLPLRDHITEYYPFVPVIGLCWLGGWAVAEAWRSGSRAMLAALGLAAVYLLMVAPRTAAASDWNYRITMRVRDLVQELARVGREHPGKTVLLQGMDSTLFWNGMLDHPHRLIGIEQVYLTPDGASDIEVHPDLGNINEFVLPAAAAGRAIARGEAVVYDVRGPRLRNVTSEYAVPQDQGLPARVDAANPLTAFLLGPEWYPAEGNHRWMPRRATLRMAGPAEAGQKLYFRGTCPEDQLRAGPLGVTVWIDGAQLQEASIKPGENDFELEFPLPKELVGKAVMQLAVEVSRTFHTAKDRRDLGLAFGVVEVGK